MLLVTWFSFRQPCEGLMGPCKLEIFCDSVKEENLVTSKFILCTEPAVVGCH